MPRYRRRLNMYLGLRYVEERDWERMVGCQQRRLLEDDDRS
jgi:hypothetical protein